jgi:hypothetical protein
VTDANLKLTVHLSMEIPTDYVGQEEMQLINNQLAELIGQVLRMDEAEEV